MGRDGSWVLSYAREEEILVCSLPAQFRRDYKHGEACTVLQQPKMPIRNMKKNMVSASVRLLSYRDCTRLTTKISGS